MVNNSNSNQGKNLINIKFNKEEIQLLKYDLQYSIQKPATTYLTSLLTGTERAIKLLDRKLQNAYCILATNKLKQILNFLSNHPIEHKMAALRCHISKMYSLPLTPEKKQKEWESIQLTARNTNFPQIFYRN